MSLNMATRLDAELTRLALYGDDRGVASHCSWSGGIMERLEGRLRDFWVSLQLVSEYTITTSKHACSCLLHACAWSHHSCRLRIHVASRCALPAHSLSSGSHSYLCFMIGARLVCEGVDWYETSSFVVWLRLRMALLPGKDSFRTHGDQALLATHSGLY